MDAPKTTSAAAILSHIDKRLSVIESRLDVIGDHEDRIRELEKARYQSAIIISITTAAITATIATFIGKALL